MTILKFAPIEPLLEKRGIVFQKPISVITDALMLFLRNSRANVLYGLAKILCSILGDSVKVTKSTDSGAGLGFLMEFS